MPVDLPRVEQWLYTTLAADATVNSIVGTRIYADEAPQEATFPMIIFAHIGNVDIVRAGANTRFAKNIFLVRAIDRGSSAVGSIMTAADRFDALLLVQNVTVGSVRIAYVQHDQGAIRKDSQDGIPMSFVGSYYQIFTQPT